MDKRTSIGLVRPRSSQNKLWKSFKKKIKKINTKINAVIMPKETFNESKFLQVCSNKAQQRVQWTYKSSLFCGFFKKFSEKHLYKSPSWFKMA